jgi:hypothetical protein
MLRSARACRALRGVAIAALAAACPGPAAQQASAPPSFDAVRAWAHLEAQVALGPRPSGSEASAKTRDYIANALAACGLEPVREPFTASTPAGELAMENVYADLAPSGAGAAAAPMVVLLSHFDTKRMPFEFVGANDAGSSTAVLLELARALAAGGPRRVAYRFLFVDGEEAVNRDWVDPDNRYGSRHHVARLAKSGAIARVKACVVLDMVGDKDLALTRDSFSDRWLVDAFFEAARAHGLGAHVRGSSMPIKDDHQSFLEEGVPSVDLIDFDYGPNNSFWHTRHDTLDKCARESLDAVGRIVLLGLPAVEQRLLAQR